MFQSSSDSVNPSSLSYLPYPGRTFSRLLTIRVSVEFVSHKVFHRGIWSTISIFVFKCDSRKVESDKKNSMRKFK